MQPTAVIIMKAGPHAGSGWQEIVEWKMGDLLRADVTLWGYGGSLCDPLRQVQPFALEVGTSIEVAMLPTTSNPENAPTVASEMSVDKVKWEPLAEGVNVTGSKCALVLDRLDLCDEVIDLSSYEVAIGPSEGKPAGDYLRHQVDKGCFRRILQPSGDDVRPVTMRGRLTRPWAVYLR